MTRDELYKQISTPVAEHPMLEVFEVRTSANGEALSKVDLCAVRGSTYRFDYVATSLVLPNEVVVPQLVTGWRCEVAPVERFEIWSGRFVVNGHAVVKFSPSGMMTGACAGPHHLDRPVLVRPGDRINAVFEGTTVEAGAIAFKLYGFEVSYSTLPDVGHFAMENGR